LVKNGLYHVEFCENSYDWREQDQSEKNYDSGEVGSVFWCFFGGQRVQGIIDFAPVQ